MLMLLSLQLLKTGVALSNLVSHKKNVSKDSKDMAFHRVSAYCELSQQLSSGFSLRLDCSF